MNNLPERRTPVHCPPIEQFNTSVIVFVTVCTHARKAILARPDVHTVLVEVWRTAETWRVGRYVLMPDHLHLFCAPASSEFTALTKWIQFWKSRASQRWPRRGEHPVWQKSFWDTQLRCGESYEAKWEYVRRNPVRKNLVSRVEDWPFAGEMCRLEWSE